MGQVSVYLSGILSARFCAMSMESLVLHDAVRRLESMHAQLDDLARPLRLYTLQDQL